MSDYILNDKGYVKSNQDWAPKRNSQSPRHRHTHRHASTHRDTLIYKHNFKREIKHYTEPAMLNNKIYYPMFDFSFN